jgi:hypothetical protein
MFGVNGVSQWTLALAKQLKRVARLQLKLAYELVSSRHLWQVYLLMILFALYKAQQRASTGKISDAGKKRLKQIRNKRHKVLRDWKRGKLMPRGLSHVRLCSNHPGMKLVPRPQNVLALDGGGIRGVVTCVLLERIIERFPDFMERIDLIAGTSTGGFIAIALASGWSPSEVLEVYEHSSGQIFSNSKRRFVGGFGGATRSKYGTSGKADILDLVCGDQRMSELMKHVVIPVLRVGDNGSYEPIAITNLPKLKPGNPQASIDSPRHCGTMKSENFDYRVADVLMCTSAAPTYFPMYYGCVDGGLFANNPSLIALTKVCEAGVTTPQNLRLLNLGTGSRRLSESAPTADLDWGVLQWGPSLLHMLMESSQSAADYSCRQLLGPRKYYRCDPTVPDEIAIELDAVGSQAALIQFARKVDITELLDWVECEIYSKSPVD